MNDFIPLIGYSDRLSGRPGDTIEFKVSSQSAEPYHAHLVRIICADPNPAGPGLIEVPVESGLNGFYPSRHQPFFPGSYATVSAAGMFAGVTSFTAVAAIWPTKAGEGEQAILSCWNATDRQGIHLYLDDKGGLRICVGATDGQVTTVSPKETLKRRHWYRVWVSFDSATKSLTVGYRSLQNNQKATCRSIDLVHDLSLDRVTRVVIAAFNGDPVHGHFNGKIESPAILRNCLNIDRLQNESFLEPNDVVARWDFSRRISSTRIEDTGPGGFHGELINLPARAMTGSNWDGTEMCWRYAPDQYGAIYFHDDDIYDFHWQTDFSFTIPEDLPSGVYAARIRSGKYYDAMPFFVCPPKDKPSADLCVLVSTYTYTVYGNHARPDFKPAWLDRIKAWRAYPWNPAVYPHYGLSTYNYHGDGSGICHASHRRPLLTLRPGYLTFGEGDCSGLRHFQADSHLIYWLEQNGIRYDIVTDQELHDDGVDAIKHYKALTTGSHPEYHTVEMLDALRAYRHGGGNLLYLGGNGFYWKVSLHPEGNGAIEIRRGEGGIRAWAAEPGEYYQAFDGGYGGLWRRNNRPPQQLAGVGFSAQGTFLGSYYRRRAETYTDPRINWIFEGIEDEILGDFGFSGCGAAGFELDRVDSRLGSADNLHVLASSENHGDTFVLVPEERLTHLTTWPGEPVEDLIRADMIYQVNDQGGQLFSSGSITFCGSLPYNRCDNNISRLLLNVITRFAQ